MELRFVILVLLLSILIITKSEGIRGPDSRLNEKRILTVRARTSFNRRGTKISDTSDQSFLESTTVVYLASNGSSTAKYSRKTISPRRSSIRSPESKQPGIGGSTTSSKPKSETTTIRNPEKQKSIYNRLFPRKPSVKNINPILEKMTLVSKKFDDSEEINSSISERESDKGNANDEHKAGGLPNRPNENAGPDNKKDAKDRRYLSKSPSDSGGGPKETARAQEQSVDPNEVTAQRGPRGRFNHTRKIDVSGGPLVFSSVTESLTRSRTGRNVQSQIVQLTVSESARRSFDTGYSEDNAASGSEIVWFHIPLDYEDSKKFEETATRAGLESPRRGGLSQGRNKPRERQHYNTETPSTTCTPHFTQSRSSNRLASGRHEITTTKLNLESNNTLPGQVDPAFRGRGRKNEFHQSKNPSVVTIPQQLQQNLDSRRRNYHLKIPLKNFLGITRGSETDSGKKQALEKKVQSLEVGSINIKEDTSTITSVKPNRPRGRYRLTSVRKATLNTTGTPTSTTTTIRPITTTTMTSFSSADPTTSFINISIIEAKATDNSQMALTVNAQDTLNHSENISTINATQAVPLKAFVSTPVTSTSGDDARGEGLSDDMAVNRRAYKEDFFNHGLGFRGRRPSTSEVDDVPPPVTTSTTSLPVPMTSADPEIIISRGNPGWTLRRRPGHWPDSQSTNPIDQPTPVKDGKLTSTTTSTLALTTNTNFKTGMRGNKTFVKTIDSKAIDGDNENENYPPEFKARIAQLQKTGRLTKAQQEATTNKATSAELFAARSRMKLQNARKLIKPELYIDETKARQVIVAPENNVNNNADDSAVEEDQKVYKISRKTSLSSFKSLTSSKVDWKPSLKLKRKDGLPVITSRYKTNISSLRSKPITVHMDGKLEENNLEPSTKASNRVGRYQDFRKYNKSITKSQTRENFPASKNDKEYKLALEKPGRKMFTPRKNDKSTVEDIKAVALKLRKSMESIDKSSIMRPTRRIDSSEGGGSTTLLTTMRTVKSFSFSTRLVKMDENEASTLSSTMKMTEEVELVPTTTSSNFDTEIAMLSNNPLDNEVLQATSPAYIDLFASAPAERVELDATSKTTTTTQTSLKKVTNSKDDLLLNEIEDNSRRVISDTRQSEHLPQAASLTYDPGSQVYVVYPSATEKPLESIAITPKQLQPVKRGDQHNSTLLETQSQPVMSVKVSEHLANEDPTAPKTSFNVFSPVESASILNNGNQTLLETLRSTVAPLLGTLGAETPVFSGVYKNTNSANSLPRVTPSGTLPKFSARYRGAELFIHKITQPTISSSQNNQLGLQIGISSPSEPKVLTVYHAKETANIKDEQTNVGQLWKHSEAIPVENTNTATTTFSTYINNDLDVTNSFNVDSSITIPIKTSTVIKTLAKSINNITTSTPKLVDDSEHSNNMEAPLQLKSASKQKSAVVSSPSIGSKNFESIEFTSESSMSTSTQLITEVSISMSDIINKNTFITSTANPLVDNKLKISGVSNYEENSMSTTDFSLTTNGVEVSNSRPLKRLDSSVKNQSKVSNLQYDITLSSSNNETTKSTNVKIQEPIEKPTRFKILAQIKTSTPSDLNNNTNTTENLNLLVALNEVTVKPFNKSMEDTNINFVSSQTTPPAKTVSQLLDVALIDEKIIKYSPETASSIQKFEKSNGDIYTTQQPKFLESENVAAEYVADSERKLNTMDVQIEIHSISNATVSAGTKKLTAMKDYLDKKETHLAFKKSLDSVLNSPEKNSFNSSFNHYFTAEFMQIENKLSNYSSNSFNPFFIVDDKKLDSSSDELSQLLGGFLDNTNKTVHVTNISTVENNYETSTVVQEINAPQISTLTSGQNTNFSNTFDANNTENHSQNFTIIIQVNDIALKTAVFSPTLTFPVNIESPSTKNPSGSLNISTTNTDALTIIRMLQLIDQFLHNKAPTNKSFDFQTQNLDTLSLDLTDPSPVDSDQTESAILKNSTSQESTTISIDSITHNLTTISPNLFTPFQDTSPATAQRTAGTKKRPNQSTTTLKPHINYPSLSTSFLIVDNTNNSFAINPQFSLNPTMMKKKLEKNVANSTTSSLLPTDFRDMVLDNIKTLSKIQHPKQQKIIKTQKSGDFSMSLQTSLSRFSISSTTVSPLRDYLIYGILPNKTIIRKKPENNFIDSRNLNSPYIIFGIFPDGKLVRKFPNGTIIPDPPSNPVEIVFSLATNTTNKPRLTDLQSNKTRVMSNKNINLFNNYNPITDVNTQKAFVVPNEVHNALNGPTSFELPIGSVASNYIKMTTMASNYNGLNDSNQNGRIIKNRSEDQASRLNENENQHDSVTINQEKLVKYWSNGQFNSIPTVLSVDIKSAVEDAKIRNGEQSWQTVNNKMEIPSPASSAIESLIKISTKSAAVATSTTTTTTTQRPLLSPTGSNSNAFGTSFKDLAFLNALLEKSSPGDATPKTLTEAEQMLANKILSLALGQPLMNGGPIQSAKAIHQSNIANSIGDEKDSSKLLSSFTDSSLQPIVIELPPSSTTTPTTETPAIWKPPKTITRTEDLTMAKTTSTFGTTSRKPDNVTRRPYNRKLITTTTKSPPTGPLAFAVNLLQTLFERNPFALQTTTIRSAAQKPTIRKTMPTTQQITNTVITTTTTKKIPEAVFIVHADSNNNLRSLQISNQSSDSERNEQSGSDNSNVIVTSAKSEVAKQLPTSTHPPEEDAKFLAALLTNIKSPEGKYVSKQAAITSKPNLDFYDEVYLRYILEGQTNIQPLSSEVGNDKNKAALLPKFLKEQGVGSLMPSHSLRELQETSQSTVSTTRQATITTTMTKTMTMKRPQRRPILSSTYPPSLFSSLASFGSSGIGQGHVRNKVVNAALGMTRAFSQFIGAAMTGAADQFHLFLKNIQSNPSQLESSIKQ